MDEVPWWLKGIFMVIFMDLMMVFSGIEWIFYGDS